MNEKKLQIIEAAIRRFAQKGYHATSIQEIVDELGIAKGSLYFYFKSKEELLISIYRYYFELLIEKMTQPITDVSLSPRERLTQKVIQHFHFILEHRDFIMMQMQERAIDPSRELQSIIFEFRAKIHYWQQMQIIQIYGEQAKPYAHDGSSLFSAMVQAYLTYILYDKKELEIQGLASFLVDRLDDLMLGMMHKQVSPILNEKLMVDFLQKAQEQGSAELALIEELQEIRAFVSKLVASSEIDSITAEDIQASLIIMEEELQKEEPHSMILKGMLAYLKGLKLPELKRALARFEEKLSVK